MRRNVDSAFAQKPNFDPELAGGFQRAMRRSNQELEQAREGRRFIVKVASRQWTL